ncbi:serine protease inhibitor 28Dc-like [Uranotaenia lowii]|uniref:serine protease inhibitor 28Dc-like n=1 Tax=Uranotaenia lowii TaxID=190385 RepID=UPI00247A8E20|nr:serine protease inhibitor 28Dc-like [Uranotaenia lowii]
MSSCLGRIFLLLLIGFTTSISTQERSSFLTSQISLDVSNAINNLAHKLAVKLRNERSKSEIISPLSIGSSVLLLLRASRGNTRNQLLELLGLAKDYQKNDGRIPKNFGYLLRVLLDVGEWDSSLLKKTPKWQDEAKCAPEDYQYEDEEDEFFPDSNTTEVNLIKLANAIFVQDGLFENDRLQGIVENLYLSVVENVDFVRESDKTKARINSWANESTNGRIPEIITDPLSPDTTMVVANALYFKAFWEDVFLAGATKPRKFFPNGEEDESVEVEMMAHGGCFPYYYSKALNARIMGFPYKNKTSTMYIIHPYDSNRSKLETLIDNLDATALDDLISNMTMRSATVQFPKLQISNSFELKTALQKLGISAMFNRGESNFSLLNPQDATGESPTVGGMLHKVFLDVNEAGTEGGAVTATLLDRSMPAINFRVTTPFLLVIRHEVTKLLLFYGPVYDPSV